MGGQAVEKQDIAMGEGAAGPGLCQRVGDSQTAGAEGRLELVDALLV